MSGLVEYIYLLNGNYLGFISANNVFSRDGEYLGWVENRIVWGKNGVYCGKLNEIDGNLYILKESYVLNPVPRVPRVAPISPVTPPPVANLRPINLSIGVTDGIPMPER